MAEVEPLVPWIFYYGVAYSTVPEVAADLALVAVDSAGVDLEVLVAGVDLALVAVVQGEVGKPFTRLQKFWSMLDSNLL